jgi:hypothetical protein
MKEETFKPNTLDLSDKRRVYSLLPKVRSYSLLYYMLMVIWSLFSTKAEAQNLDYDAIKGATKIKINGGVSANSVFYNSNQRSSREPFTYMLQGNINISWLTFAIPISYSYSNQGSNLGYSVPFNFNRVALNPKYKWIQGHVGDVSMTFSPYTLSGHQFTGAGVELTPKSPLKFSAMYGRLLKPVEFESDKRTIPSFKRMGYGAKISYEKEKYKFGLIGFYAKDDVNSIFYKSDSILKAQENLVISVETGVQITKSIKANVEYAATSITNDTRSNRVSRKVENLSSLLFRNRSNTENYNAIKGSLDYIVGKTKVGLGYERVDAGYKTLGAYFFNNDFENITFNASQPFIKDKVNLSMNFGLQRDDLQKNKAQNTKRLVGTFNAAYQASEKLNFTASYTNMSNYTNVRANQFDEINAVTAQSRADSLRFRQLSQNANFTATYNFGNKEKLTKNINFNYSLAASANEQGGLIHIGQANSVHNFASSYGMNFIKSKTTINLSVNYTLNKIGREDATIFGPTLSVSKKVLKDKLNTNFSISYNTSSSTNGNASNMNLRLMGSYVYKEKHNFNLSAIQLFRSVENNNAPAPIPNVNELIVTFGYSYSFSTGGKKEEKKKRKTRRKP